MIKTIFYCMIFLIGLSAQADDVGLGVVLGSPTGFTGKWTLSKENAIDGVLAWDFRDDYFHVHGDYLWLKNAGLRVDKVNLDWYFGVGARLNLTDHFRAYHDHKDDFQLGVRGPIGIGYTFQKSNIELFGELALVVDIVQSTDAELDGGIGVRFHF